MNREVLGEIALDAKKKMQTYSELVEELGEEGSSAREWGDRQEAKENAAHYEGRLLVLKKAVNEINGGLSRENFLVMMEDWLRSTINEMKELSHYTGRSLGWMSYIISGVLYHLDEDTYLALASLVGGLHELIDLDKRYVLGLDRGLIRSAKAYGTLHREGGGGTSGPREWWPSRE
jgi:hypothetical protein